ncbi:MAG: alpha-L-fucosidase [Anaerolineae bacterium]|nr:MAG: alpha-L-fucosidase [Anaerolineae bacterium]
MTFQPTLESIREHVVPNWFHDAKLGIFIHWGLYSVPAWAPLTGELGKVTAEEGWVKWFSNNPYAEWYMNSMRIEGSPTHQHHTETYGADFAYTDFVSMFNEATTGWDPTAWADLFQRIGARYVVLTTKHHDGFLLWPSERPNPHRQGHMAARDLVGALTDAVRAQGMRMGLYYSGGTDWTFNPTVVRDIRDLQAAIPQGPEYVEYADNHWRELIRRYAPSVIWNDIAYPAAADLNGLFAHYYNTVPEGVINDRFTQHFDFSEGQVTGSRHFDFRTPEYAQLDEITDHKWEATRGIGYSFGYNQNEGPDNCLSVGELVRSFVDIVSKNGNLLLNVGPRADGTIPELQRERLLGLGAWLEVNGEAVFGTQPWVTAEGKTTKAVEVRFTQAGDSLYATLLDKPPASEIELLGLRAHEGTTVHLLGQQAPLVWEQRGEALAVVLPGTLSPAPAHSLRITPQPQAIEAVLLARAGSLSIDSKLREILDDEAGRAVLEKNVPGMLDSPQLEMAMAFSLPEIAGFVPQVLTPEVLAAIAEDLEEL